MLKISLLGKTKIEYQGEDLEPRLSTKTIAMVYLLIANQGKYVQKDKIMVYLWPDSAEEAARYNLRYNLWILKKVLPPGPNGETLIRSDKDSCILNDSYPLECDLLTIKGLDYRNCGIDQLLHAKNLFCGDIMEGWYLKNCNEFNEYILLDRMTCESRQIEILTELADRYETAAEYAKALEVLKEVAAFEPENETVALRIMKLYAASGNRTAALNYYKFFEAGLWSSLKITPAEAITRFCRELQLTAGREKTPAPEELPALTICGCCMDGVQYFLLSDIVCKALKQIDLSYLSELDQPLAADLSHIQRSLLSIYARIEGVPLTPDADVSDVRIIQGFLSFMELLTEHYQIELKIRNIHNIDETSAKVVDYLRAMELENLRIYEL